MPFTVSQRITAIALRSRYSKPSAGSGGVVGIPGERRRSGMLRVSIPRVGGLPGFLKSPHIGHLARLGEARLDVGDEQRDELGDSRGVGQRRPVRAGDRAAPESLSEALGVLVVLTG